MPIYEYHCPGCDNLFEEWCLRIDDEKTKPCPACGKEAKRIISHTSFALKGEGWYVTEYGAKKDIKEQTAAKDSPNGSGTDKSSSPAPDSGAAKPASASCSASSGAAAP